MSVVPSFACPPPRVPGGPGRAGGRLVAAMSWVLALVFTLPVLADPRIPLAEHTLAADPAAALEAAAVLQSEQPKAAARMGLSYLRGRLLEELGRPDDADVAYGQALGEAPQLVPYARYRLAADQERIGHPEVAAGVVAPVFDQDVPESLLEPATQLFARAIAEGGDCRILRGVLRRRLPDPERRLLQVVEAECLQRAGSRARAAEVLCAVLDGGREDDAARRAADQLDDIAAREPAVLDRLITEGCDGELLAGLTFHQHREFDRSTAYLERAVARRQGHLTVATDEEFEARYALARGYFWREQFALAAAHFGNLALRARDLEERAKVLYQQARSQELDGNWDAADAGFRRTFQTLPKGDLAGPALLSALRLEWRSGEEVPALHLLGMLSRLHGAEEHAARADLFLAASDIVRGRADRADGWLRAAAKQEPGTELEVEYWRGRLAELGQGEGAASEAVAHYLAVLLEAPYHPLARDAFARLQKPGLRAAAETEGRRRASSREPDDLFAAWLLLGDASGPGRAARKALAARYASAPDTAAFFRLSELSVASWPLWSERLDEAPEMLLALGLVDDGVDAVDDHFPASDADLAYTGSLLLARDRQVRRSMLLASAFARPLTDRVEAPFQPRKVRTLLYPLAWDEPIGEQARRFGVDPFLLAAVIREESRFDARARSQASARGLTQFVFLTARRLATEVGMGTIAPGDLYRPEVSITLGAAYVAELERRFSGSLQEAVAAYNAGPAQADLWQTYCFTRELPEYYSKVGFTETRAYLRRVLASREQYAELYPDLGR